MFNALPDVQTGARRLSPVIYQPTDYIGLLPRLLIFFVDGIVLWVAYFLIATPIVVYYEMSQLRVGPLIFLVPMTFIWWYLTFLKRSRFRTLGYRLVGARIETLYGRPPEIWRLTMRMMLSVTWMVGFPAGFFLDCLWTSMGDDRQTFRDVFCGTRLVRNTSKPIGDGRLVYCLWMGLGRIFLYARVRPVNSLTAQSPVLREVN